MSHGEAIQFWIGLLGWLAVEITLVIAIVAAWQLLTASANRRRIIWQAGLLGAAMLLVFETTGVGPGLAHWALLRLYIQPAPTTPAPARVPPPAQSPAARLKTAGPALEPARSLAALNDALVPMPAEPVIPWWPGVVWVAGTGLVLGWILFSRILLLVFRWRHAESEDPVLQERVRILARQLGLRGRVRVVESASLTSPIAFGIVWPIIGVPAKFPRMFSEEEQNVMLTHELAHLANHDPAWYLLSDLVVAALWWHPLVWWSRWQIQTHSEIAADEACLILEDGPALLAGCLVAVARRWRETATLGLLRMAGNGFKSSLGKRVERLLNMDGRRFERPHRGRALLAKVTGSLALAALAVICTASSTLPSLAKPMSRSVQVSWSSSVAGQSFLAALGTDNPMALVETKTKPVEHTAVEQRLAQVGKKTKDVDRLAAAQGTPLIHTSPGRQKIKAKLDRIVLPEVFFDNVPLSEAVQFLSDQARKLDPEKKGVNLSINSQIIDLPNANATPPLDALGLPVGPVTAKIDLDKVIVRINPALHNLTLAQAIDVVAKAATHPIRTSLEDYAVVFYATSPVNAALTTRTYQADPNTFQQGLQNVTTGANAAQGGNNSGNNASGGGAAGTAALNSNAAFNAAQRQALLARLDSIVLPEVEFEGVPLHEVIAVLYREAKKQTPNSEAITFMINTPLVDASGRAATAANSITDAIVTLTPALHNVTLAKALDAVARAADQAVKVTVESYAVVFVQDLPVPPPLYSKVYKVDPAKVLSVLGKKSFVSDDLRNYFISAGVLSPTNTGTLFQTFLNEAKGLLMLRTTREALEKIDKLMNQFNATVQPTTWPQPPPATAAPANSRGQNNQPIPTTIRVTRTTLPAPTFAPGRGIAVARSTPPSRPAIPTITTATISAESLHTILQHPQVKDAIRLVTELYAEE